MHERQSTRRPWWALAAGLAALALTTAACGDDGDDSDDASSTEATEDEAAEDATDEGATDEGATDDGGSAGGLEVTEFEFADVTAPAGGSLEVTNSSGGAHTFTADDGAFDESLPDGDTVTVTVPAEPGEYTYHCEIHPDMAATLTAQ
jgi:plastocyanin